MRRIGSRPGPIGTRGIEQSSNSNPGSEGIGVEAIDLEEARVHSLPETAFAPEGWDAALDRYARAGKRDKTLARCDHPRRGGEISFRIACHDQSMTVIPSA